jgi:two-component system response regulator PilR (NtrC family)
MPRSILVVDDEPAVRDTLQWCLEDAGYHVDAVASGEQALHHLRAEPSDVVITDLVMPGIDGLELLGQARILSPRTPVMLMTGYATVETAVEALRRGAADYIFKPFRPDDVRERVQRLLDNHPAAAGCANAERAAEDGLVGRSAILQALRRHIGRVAPTSSHVLITGETGTGKDLVARAIHAQSPRQGRPFVAINCGAIPETLFESVLFGHARGAFTGAVQASAGLIASADRGTLFLDEVAEIPLHLQAKLLRFLEDKEALAVGRTKSVRVDCRIVASTNRDLRRELAAGRFRDDLFYRLRVVQLHLPPLRERRDDIPCLVEHFVHVLNGELDTKFGGVDRAVLDALMEHDWPGNVRELRHVIESAMIAGGPGAAITREDLPVDIAPASPSSLKSAARVFERQRIVAALASTGFDKKAAARQLGLSLASLYRKLDGSLA